MSVPACDDTDDTLTFEAAEAMPDLCELCVYVDYVMCRQELSKQVMELHFTVTFVSTYSIVVRKIQRTLALSLSLSLSLALALSLSLSLALALSLSLSLTHTQLRLTRTEMRFLPRSRHPSTRSCTNEVLA